MPRYLIAFDIDTRAMREDLVTRQGMSTEGFVARRNRLYRSEIPAALSACGAIRRKQGSVYYLDCDQGLDATISEFARAAADHAPSFCRYVRNVVIAPVGRGRDITPLIADRS